MHKETNFRSMTKGPKVLKRQEAPMVKSSCFIVASAIDLRLKLVNSNRNSIHRNSAYIRSGFRHYFKTHIKFGRQ